MLDSLVKIPKGVNIILFIWMLLGLFWILRTGKIKQKNRLYLFFAVAGFMIGWRVIIRLITSRYAVGMVIPFSIISAFFLIDSAKKRHVLVRLVFFAFVLCTSVIYVKMNFDSVSRHHYSVDIADVFERFRPNERLLFVVRYHEYNRVCFLNHFKDNVEVVRPEKDFNDYLADKKAEKNFPDMVLNYQTKESEGEIHGWKGLRKIVAFPQNRDGTKKQVISTYSSSQGMAAVSKSSGLSDMPDLLKDGDLENLSIPKE